MIYYVAEVLNSGSYRSATKIEASDLSEAKRKASRMQRFMGTVLQIGTSVNSKGFLRDCIAEKKSCIWHEH